MRAADLTRDDCGKRVTWTDKDGRHSIILGHLHHETYPDRAVVLVRDTGDDQWSGWVLDGRRRVVVEP